MKLLYRTKAKTIGGREGFVELADGNIKLKLSIPKSIGGPGVEGAINFY